MLLLKNELSEVYCTINYLETQDTIYVQWSNKANLEQVKEASLRIIELQKNVSAHAFLSDYTKCKGFEQNTLEYLNSHFFPQLAQNGIKKHAFVFSEVAFKRIMGHAFSAFYSNLFEINVFNSIQKSNEWLQNTTIKSAS